MKKIIFSTLIGASCLITQSMASEINLKACMGCHGKTFEKKAMGKSKIVKDLTHKEIYKALKGYKEGTYGGPMKAVMKGQVSKYTDEELENASNKLGKKDLKETTVEKEGIEKETVKKRKKITIPSK